MIHDIYFNKSFIKYQFSEKLARNYQRRSLVGQSVVDDPSDYY